MDKYTYIPVRKKCRNEDINHLIKSLSIIGSNSLLKDWDETDVAHVLKQIMNNSCFPKEFTVFLERNYVDRVYRDIYYHHYASRHFEQPRNCLRLFFFKNVWEDLDELQVVGQENFIGVCVVQPNGILGRSYFHPRYFLTKGNYVRTVEFHINFLGKTLKIPAFPYTMQDREATTCAEVTVLNLVEYYSCSYSEYKSILPSDIENVEAEHSAERIFPSHGMSYLDVARSLAKTGLSPRIYASQAPYITREAMRRYFYYYIESGIPFGIAVESPERGVLHSMVCIGHGPRNNQWPNSYVINHLSIEENETGKEEFHSCWIANSADAYQTFIVMDDNDIPYQTVQLEVAQLNWTEPQVQKNGRTQLAVEHVCVPLYKRVFLEVDGAEEMFVSLLTSKMGFCSVMKRCEYTKYQKLGEKKTNPLIIRLFLASSRTFLAKRIEALNKMNIEDKKMDEECINIYQNLCCPRFVWVCEIYDKTTFLEYKKDDKETIPHPIGEIVMDATTHRTGTMSGMNGVVLIHYPHYITYRDPDSRWSDLEENAKRLLVWEPFEQFCGNLTDYQQKRCSE